MIKQLLFFFVLCFLVSCKSRDSKQKQIDSTRDTLNSSAVSVESGINSLKKLGIYSLEGDSLTVPPFEIEIALSPKASERISGKETIIIDVFLTGTPIDASKVELEEDGSFYVGSVKREISPGQIAIIDNFKFPKTIYDQLAQKDVDFSVNVYTGRKSSPDNLLDCEYLDGRLSTAINKHFTLKAKLIGE